MGRAYGAYVHAAIEGKETGWGDPEFLIRLVGG
jgi:hypothetical protein